MSYITWQELAAVICFMLLCTVCIYIIVLVKNINDNVKLVKKLLKENKEGIEKTLKNAPVISENLVEITGAAKSNLKVMETALHNIGETVEMTAATAYTVRHDILGKVKNIVDLIDLIWRVFFKSKDAVEEKKDERSA